MITLPTYMTTQEKVRWLDNVEPELADLFRDCLSSTADLEKEIASLQKCEELLEEQLCFARDAFAQIRHNLNAAKSAKQALTEFESVMADSLFEE